MERVELEGVLSAFSAGNVADEVTSVEKICGALDAGKDVPDSEEAGSALSQVSKGGTESCWDGLLVCKRCGRTPGQAGRSPFPGTPQRKATYGAAFFAVLHTN